MIVPAEKLNGNIGIKIEACNGWVISNENFSPNYLKELRTADPMTAQTSSSHESTEFKSKHLSEINFSENITLNIFFEFSERSDMTNERHADRHEPLLEGTTDIHEKHNKEIEKLTSDAARLQGKQSVSSILIRIRPYDVSIDI